MTSEELVTVAKYSDPHEAAMVRAMLESGGISGLVVGGEINNTLWHLGTTISGVELKVPESEAERAAEIIETHRSERQTPTHGKWTCPECGEKVDADFDVCWFCEAPYAERTTTDELSASKPQQEESNEAEVEILEPLDFDTDEMTFRALKAAAIGVVFFPACVYAIFLLLELGDKELSKTGLKRFYWSVFLVFVTLLYLLGLFFAF